MRILAALLTLITAQAQTIVVGHKNSDTAGFYDSATGKILATVPTGHKPHEIVLSADGSKLFVANYGLTRWTDPERGGNSITVIDVKKRQVAGTISLGEYYRPHGIERGPSGRIYIVCGRPGTLLAIDPASHAIVAKYPLEGADPHMVAIHPNERKFYINNATSADVTVLTIGATTTQKRIRIGGIPMGLALTRDGKTLYSTNRSGNAVAIINTDTDTVDQFLDISGEPVRARLIRNDNILLVTTILSGDLVVVNARSRQIFHRQHAGNQLEGLAVDQDERWIFTSAQNDDFVQALSVGDWRLGNLIRTSARPDPIVVLR